MLRSMIRRNPNLDMKMQATKMAMQGLSQGDESQQMNPEGDQVKAPVIPTTNTNLPKNPKQPLQPAKGMSVSGASGIPVSSSAPPPSGTVGGFANINVTGPGNRAEQARQNTQPTDQTAAFDSAINDLLTGNVRGRDTTAEESAIREEIARSASANQAELMARMGAGGGGTSGALSALTGDLQIKAANEAIGQINDLRSQARDERLAQIEAGVAARNKAVEVANQEKVRQAYLDILNKMYGLKPDESQAPDWSPDFTGDSSSSSSPPPSNNQPEADYMLGSSSALPENAKKVGSNSSYDIYQTDDGTTYYVPKGT